MTYMYLSLERTGERASSLTSGECQRRMTSIMAPRALFVRASGPPSASKLCDSVVFRGMRIAKYTARTKRKGTM